MNYWIINEGEGEAGPLSQFQIEAMHKSGALAGHLVRTENGSWTAPEMLLPSSVPHTNKIAAKLAQRLNQTVIQPATGTVRRGTKSIWLIPLCIFLFCICLAEALILSVQSDQIHELQKKAPISGVPLADQVELLTKQLSERRKEIEALKDAKAQAQAKINSLTQELAQAQSMIPPIGYLSAEEAGHNGGEYDAQQKRPLSEEKLDKLANDIANELAPKGIGREKYINDYKRGFRAGYKQVCDAQAQSE